MGALINSTSANAGGRTQLSNNVYVDESGNYSYINTDEASLYKQIDGIHTWHTAASGSADAHITFLERFRIDPAGHFTFTGKDANSNQLIMKDSGGAVDGYVYAEAGEIGFLDKDGAWAIKHTGDSMTQFSINGSEIARVQASGVTFNGDSAAANALDDYEEGTWTPTIASDASPTAYNYRNGYYTKVGRMVHITGQLRLSTIGSFSGATVNLGGFPFTISNSSNYDPRGVVGLKGAGVAKSEVFCRGVANTLYARIEQGNGGTADDRNMNANAVDTGTIVFIDLVYFVD
jgi:hypothetical protein